MFTLKPLSEEGIIENDQQICVMDIAKIQRPTVFLLDTYVKTFFDLLL